MNGARIVFVLWLAWSVGFCIFDVAASVSWYLAAGQILLTVGLLPVMYRWCWRGA